MKKKQLNRRQLSRIQDRQDAFAAGADDAQALRDGLPVDAAQRQGLVISNFGQQLEIEALDGEDKGALFRCFVRSNLEPLVTGDEVVWQAGEPQGVVVAGLPRRSVLKRPNNFGELKSVAANIDRLIIVIAPVPEPHFNLIDRYLVAAEHSRIRPLLLLNKTDLLNTENRAPLQDMLGLYRSIGYDTAEVSCKAPSGLAELKRALKDHTSIFVGQSGVGKSALVNALLPGINTLEGKLSDAVIKGKHTTTSARLFHFPDGGRLIDSPGIREFGLWHMEADDLLAGFREFGPWLDQCRFRDCRHEQEPGCSLLQAAAQGDVDERRLASFRLIRASLKVEH